MKNQTSNNIIIRNETKEDYRKVEKLVRESFGDLYRPGCYEHYIVHKMRDDKNFIHELDLILELNDQIIGQVMFVKTCLKVKENDIEVLTLGPICIDSKFKRKGLGQKLLNYSLMKAKELGYKAVLLEGNILFYGKSGFDYAYKYQIKYPGLNEFNDSSFFLRKELEKGYIKDKNTEYIIPECYYATQNEVEEFDKTFQHKAKHKYSTQIF